MSVFFHQCVYKPLYNDVVHMIPSVSVTHSNRWDFLTITTNAFIVGKVCYCYYTYFVNGVKYLNMADVTDVSM